MRWISVLRGDWKFLVFILEYCHWLVQPLPLKKHRKYNLWKNLPLFSLWLKWQLNQDIKYISQSDCRICDGMVVDLR